METNRTMVRCTTWLVGLFCIAMTPIAWGEDQTAPAPDIVPAHVGKGVSAIDVISPDDIVPIPEHYTVRTHVFRVGEGLQPSTAGPAEKLIYSNTLGQRLLRFNVPNRRYADDIVTDSIEGCNMSRYIVRVNGGVPGGVGEFSCKTALFTACPSVAGGGVLIPGTEGDFQGMPDDSSEMQDLVVDLSNSPVPIPPSLWVRVECDKGSASWVGAAPAETGFTQDRFFHPATGCDSFLGPDFYAGFYLQIFADSPAAMPCETHFLAYAATSPTLPALSCGAGQQCADDFATILAPTGESCVLSAYEVGMRGANGAYVMNIDLRFPFTDFPIQGTEMIFNGVGDNRQELARRIIDPNIDIIIPASPLWVKWESDQGGTGLINARFPAAGFSDDEFFGRFLGPPIIWAPLFANPRAAVYLIIYCRGETPRGACCRNQLTGNNQPLQCVDDQPVIGCLRPARWLKDTTCLGNEFEPPCGEHACCTPNGCQDATYTECTTFLDPTSLGLPCTDNTHCPGRVCQMDGFCSPRSGVWQNTNGQFCDPGVPIGIPFNCPFYQCFFAAGDCFDAEDEICCAPQFGCDPAVCPLGTKCDLVGGLCTSRAGCNNLNCCNAVCSADGFCCEVAWDPTCVNRATNICEIAPGNDICANDSSLAQGAQAITLSPAGPPGRFIGFVEANNSFAIAHPGDPLACCNKAGASSPVAGTLWYKFVMPTVTPPVVQPTTARLHTCGTPGSNVATDAILAVFAVGDPSTETSSCTSLSIIGCNDDRAGCGSGQQADLCLENLVPGATYYVMMGATNAQFQGQYSIDVEVPCNRTLPANNTCFGSQSIPGTPVNLPFTTINATLDCPAEDCVNAMKNDLWYDFTASCLGKATFETCGGTGQPDPATSIAVYRVANTMNTCDVDTGDLVGCNDNALVNAAEHTRRSQTCVFSGLECDTSVQCESRCSISGDPCTTVADCHFCLLQPDRPCNTNTDCLTCFFDDPMTGDPISCTMASEGETLECPGFNNRCRFTSENSCFKPHDDPLLDIEEVCVKEPCLSSCGNAASVTIPVVAGELYKVRMGGDFGAEVMGSMKVTCEPHDCNNNNIPDLKEVQMGTATDCNENEVLDSCEITPAKDCNGNAKLDVCEISRDSTAPGGPFFCVVSCDPDVDNDGIPDNCGPGTGCDMISASAPVDCDIDARQSHDLKNATPAQGTTMLQITLDTGCNASTMNAGDFTVSVQGGAGPAPTISNVSGAGNVATITFAAPIPTSRWTCVALASTPAQQVCIGFLPGDVNASRVTNTQDTTALVTALTAGGQPLTLTDMNRSGVLTAEDLIRHLDLLNGGDTYTPWATQQISVPCP